MSVPGPSLYVGVPTFSGPIAKIVCAYALGLQGWDDVVYGELK